ncbi:MAG: chorismate synthase [Myxococcota bacterium]
MGSSFGTLFRVTTAGESHGPANVVIVDGCPAGLELCEEDLLPDLARRRPGQSAIVTQRKEADAPEILSGVFDGRTTGTPIAVIVRNKDQRGRDYANLANTYRPGHADYTFDAKYGARDYRGGGRSSARETVSRVVAGAIAKKLLAHAGVSLLGFVRQVGDVIAKELRSVDFEQVERLSDGSPNIVRCPDHDAAARMIALIKAVRKSRDSIGGAAEFRVLGLPPGLGEPVFDKLRADLGKAILSLPAVMGVEFGSGFAAATMRGSEHNDHFAMDGERVVTRTNRHGGMLGGISTGMPIVLRAVVKPTSSLPQEQPTVTSEGEETTVATKGRHDPCLLPRFVPMGEAMIAITLADHWLRHRAARLE